MNLKQIRSGIGDELDYFEKFFQNSMKSNVALLDRIMYYIVKRKGKQMRPMFVLLSAKIFKPISDSSYLAASLIELLHTASLVHDDVVDDAYQRRGFFSVNAIWKNKIAVLVGDYLLSRGLLLAVEKKEYKSLEIVSRAVKEMSEGELLQMEKARKLDITEDVYFDIIKQKTATLIAASCASGAFSTTQDEAIADKFWNFGIHAGIAFQIKDDLFDYGKSEIGKPRGIDIKEKKMTLPLIYVLQKADKQKKKWILRTVKKHNKDKKRVNELIEYVVDHGGLEYAHARMLEYKNSAAQFIVDIPESANKTALLDLVDFVVTRKK